MLKGIVGSTEFTVLQQNLKECTRGHGRMFVSAKGKQQMYFQQLQFQEQCIDHNYPISPFGIFACTVFPTTFLEIAVLS